MLDGPRFKFLWLFYYDYSFKGFGIFFSDNVLVRTVVVNRGRPRARPWTNNYESRARELVIFIIPPSRLSIIALQVSKGFTEIVAPHVHYVHVHSTMYADNRYYYYYSSAGAADFFLIFICLYKL